MTMAIAQLAASAMHLAALNWATRRVTDPDFGGAKECVCVREIFDFFWPVALTSVMFSLSRPILYMFLARLPDPAPVLASMRVGFDFAIIFHNLLNQFRHLFATYGREDLAGVRRFLIRTTAFVFLGMLIVAFTPVSAWFLRGLIGVRDEVLVQSRQVLMVMCALPLMVAWRNYYHGVAIINRKTGPMGLSAVMRNVMTYVLSAGLFAAGWINHITAAAILVIGFLAETLTMIYWHPFKRQARNALAYLPWFSPGREDDD